MLIGLACFPSHRKLRPIQRTNLPTKYKNLIKQLYKDPTFYMEIDGQQSDWHKQEAGIRQGCPLSPYLFLIVMTVLFHDIPKEEALSKDLERHRLIGALFDEILYAGDTIIHSTTPESVTLLLHKIDEEGATYGLKLNQGKCEALAVRDTGVGRVYFKNGTQVNELDESKYL